MLAAKAAIATRVDALGEETNTDLGIEHRAKVETRIRQLEGGQVSQISGSAKKSAKFDKFEAQGEVLEYKAAADVTSGGKRKGSADSDDEEDEKPAVKKIKVEEAEVKSEKKKKKKKDKTADGTAEEGMDTSEVKTEEVVEKKKKKKKDKEAPEEANSTLETTADASLLEEGGEKKKKKKKKKEAE